MYKLLYLKHFVRGPYAPSSFSASSTTFARLAKKPPRGNTRRVDTKGWTFNAEREPMSFVPHQSRQELCGTHQCSYMRSTKISNLFNWLLHGPISSTDEDAMSASVPATGTKSSCLVQDCSWSYVRPLHPAPPRGASLSCQKGERWSETAIGSRCARGLLRMPSGGLVHGEERIRHYGCRYSSEWANVTW